LASDFGETLFRFALLALFFFEEGTFVDGAVINVLEKIVLKNFRAGVS
jgi:hypothetical protein